MIENALDLIKQVLVKHSAAVLEEMHDQIVARNEEIKQLQIALRIKAEEHNCCAEDLMLVRGERDKFMDQVRHTCVRAEKAEAENARICALHKALMKEADDRAEKAEAELAEARRDALRYRYAKPILTGEDNAVADSRALAIASALASGKTGDAAIDAARSAT